MKTFLLLLISLMTGCDAAADDKRCSETWATCEYPKDRTYHRIDVSRQSHRGSSSEMNAWENEGTFFLYHETRKKKLRVVFTQSHKGTDKFQCHFYQKTTSQPENQKLEEGDCKCDIHLSTTQTYASAKTNITCGNRQSRVQFFCKQVGSSCVNILSSNSRFSLSAGNVSVGNVSSHDQGVYWCGLRPAGEGYCAALRKIQLEVHNITIHKMSFSVGQMFTHWCQYTTTNAHHEKFLCKGEDPSGCERVVSSSRPKSEKFEIQDDKGKRNMTITMRNLKAEDAGTYWCGAESTSRTRGTKGTGRTVIFSRLDLTEVSEARTTSTTSIRACVPPVSSTSSSPRGARAGLTAALVSVAVLLLALSLLWVYTHFKSTANGEVQGNKEEHTYAEIQELPSKLDSGTAMRNTYVTATFATNPSAFLHGSACPSSSSDPAGAGDALYSTVNLPQT